MGRSYGCLRSYTTNNSALMPCAIICVVVGVLSVTGIAIEICFDPRSF
jgi:hypothetical protein